MISIDNPLPIDFEQIDIDPFWNVGSEREHKSHRIHAYPAKFPAFITQKALGYAKDSGLNINCIADIFCGCGTVAFEAKRMGIDFWGCDLNPVAVLIAKVKSSDYCAKQVDHYYAKILGEFDNHNGSYVLPAYINPRIVYWFNSEQIRELSLLKKCIFDSIPHNSKYLFYFLCAFSNILKPTSKWLTKSIKPQLDPTKTPAQVRAAFISQCLSMRTALVEENNILCKSKTTIKCKDALTIRKSNFADLIISSPPYVTSYEYADLHQLSSLWLDYAEDYRDLRKNSIGSSHNCFHENNLDDLNESGRLIFNSLNSIDKAKARSVAKYYLDMQHVTTICKKMLTPNGLALMVIGNTEYKGVRIDNVKHLCESMLNSGFQQVSVTKRKISGKILTPYRDESGRFSSSSEKRKVYGEEFIVIGR